MNRRRRGAALLEFALSLPFALLLFVGIGDFSAFFWHQLRLEEASRDTIGRILPERAALVTADATGLAVRGHALENTLHQQTKLANANLALHHLYACPTATGAERAPTPAPQRCPGERVYLEIRIGQPVDPLLRPLLWMGYPRAAVARHLLRIR